ncbi:GntR family transcriptional regulator [Okibacterium sp. HSC-33S16]|uniref:GntR family transcriptional regulator n=1 Tax=Okibacterium sp. HSC-33S16 TaxID=2910965 RepID=UPI0020A0ECA3|nr:GntR family transcriptional regulator [Okibacterium sp. HSC-33S16]MCP2030653.1 GntR family transcriptional regulator [Okibacterium sp. HSC-33S16]
MLLRIDQSSTTPLFDQLASSIRGAAITGGVKPGERLPAARDLAESLEVNVHTVLRAYQLLRDEGLVELRRGRGAVVTDRAERYSQLSAAIDTVVVEARALGIAPDTVTALLREALK